MRLSLQNIGHCEHLSYKNVGMNCAYIIKTNQPKKFSKKGELHVAKPF